MMQENFINYILTLPLESKKQKQTPVSFPSYITGIEI